MPTLNNGYIVIADKLCFKMLLIIIAEHYRIFTRWTKRNY
jgi:hypothetical protein